MFVFKPGQLTSSLRGHKRFAQPIRKTTWRRIPAHQPIGPAMLKTYILQPVENAQQFRPFWRDVRFELCFIHWPLGTHASSQKKCWCQGKRQPAQPTLRASPNSKPLAETAIDREGFDRWP